MVRAAVLSALYAAPLLAPGTAAGAAMATTAPEPVWLQISLNGQSQGVELLLREGAHIWIDPALLDQWRLAIPLSAVWHQFPEGRFVLLASLPEVSSVLDEAAQHLELTVGAGALKHHQLRARREPAPVPQTAATGSFLNYELSATRAAADHALAGSFEWGVFGPAGHGTTTFLAGDTAFGGHRLVRLSSSWVRDDPQGLRTFSVGDAISAGGSFGRSRRFGGLQWGSNFALQPDLVTFPLPSASGSSTVPATVDVYVDQVLRLRQEVPAGPFELTDLPVTTGLGQTELVITDALGRQQRLPYSFYTSATLLRPGLRAWQYSVGLERQSYGQSSFDYGDPVVSGSERYGVSDRLTVEWQGEWAQRQLRSGIGATWLANGFGTGQLLLAGSRAAAGSGVQVAMAMERRAAAFSFSGSLAWSSSGFDAAALPGERAPQLRQQAALNWSLERAGSLSLGWLKQRRHDGSAVELATLGYSRSVGALGFLNLSVQYLSQPESDLAVSLSLTMPLAEQRSASFAYSADDDAQRYRAEFAQSPPAGRGLGYRLLAQAGAEQRLDAGLVYQGAQGVLRAELSRLLGQTRARVQLGGGLLLLGGSWHASRPLTDSFAVVDVADYPGVRIYADNQWVATTDAQGQALLPRLRPWQRNRLHLEQLDLPLDARIDALALEAVPPARSGLALKFAVQPERSATLRLLLADGLPVPPGSEVELLPAGRRLPLGLDGLLFVDGLAAVGNRLRLTWRAQRCEVPLALPADGSPQPDLGSLTCTGVAR